METSVGKVMFFYALAQQELIPEQEDQEKDPRETGGCDPDRPYHWAAERWEARCGTGRCLEAVYLG